MILRTVMRMNDREVTSGTGRFGWKTISGTHHGGCSSSGREGLQIYSVSGTAMQDHARLTKGFSISGITERKKLQLLERMLG